jgi:hypothetical protein
MNVHTVRLFVALLFLSAASPGLAQTSGGVPPAIWTQIEALGPVVDPVNVRKIYASLHAQMPTDGVKKTLTIAYGPADAQKLDVYEPATPVTKAPVLIFIHGGASGLAGVILGSGLYGPSLDPFTPGDPPNAPDAAYYGADQKTYAARSTALHADAAKIPTLIFEVEHDPLPMLIANGNFYSLLCHRDNQCPLMYRFLMHDHISAPSAINTGDETVSTPLLNFIRAR